MREAVIAFLADKAELNLSKNWLQKYRCELPQLASWCERKVRYIELRNVDLLALEDYRKTWTGAPATRRKRQERLRSFYRCCVRHRWITYNVAADLESIRTKTPLKVPLTGAEFAAAMTAAGNYHLRGRDGEWRRLRAIAMLLLLRWSGLRINDAAKQARSRLTQSGSLFLYTQKTGEPVYVPPTIFRPTQPSSSPVFIVLVVAASVQPVKPSRPSPRVTILRAEFPILIGFGR